MSKRKEEQLPVNKESTLPAESMEIQPVLGAPLKAEDLSFIGQLASAYASSSLVPFSLRGRSIEETKNNVLIAMLHLHSIGVNPIAQLHNIAVIQGRPVIWGDLLKALALKSGLLVDYKMEIKKEKDNITAICTVKRRNPNGEPLTFIGKFSYKDAQRAGLLSKESWKKYPIRMLENRARAFALRDAFPDILGGLGLREELEDELVNEPSDEISAMKAKLEQMKQEEKENETVEQSEQV